VHVVLVDRCTIYGFIEVKALNKLMIFFFAARPVANQFMVMREKRKNDIFLRRRDIIFDILCALG
jgi:hypothetical protein